MPTLNQNLRNYGLCLHESHHGIIKAVPSLFITLQTEEIVKYIKKLVFMKNVKINVKFMNLAQKYTGFMKTLKKY